MMAADAVLEMEKHSCTYLPVVSEDKTLEGVVTVKDLLAAGL
jgi:CBS domain-containing protein